jgi:hypothetical protein
VEDHTFTKWEGVDKAVLAHQTVLCGGDFGGERWNQLGPIKPDINEALINVVNEGFTFLALLCTSGVKAGGFCVLVVNDDTWVTDFTITASASGGTGTRAKRECQCGNARGDRDAKWSPRSIFASCSKGCIHCLYLPFFTFGG